MKAFSTSGSCPVVLAAVDIAKSSQQALIEPPTGRRKALSFPNSRDGFEQFTRELERYKCEVHVAFEATGDYHRGLAAFLSARGIRLHLVSSIATHRTREALYNSWDKNDPKDAQVILHLLKTGGTQIYHDPFVNGYNDLQELSNTYRQISLRKTRIYHTIVTHFLPMYFPEAGKFVTSSRSDWFFRLLIMAPCPSAIVKLSKKEYIKAASAIQYRKFDRDRWLADFYETANDSVGVPVLVDSVAMQTFRLVLADYLHVCTAREELETAAAAHLKDHPDFKRLQTIPGVGPVLALTILAESGNLRRFNHYRQFLKYCGLDLCTEQSGSFRGTTRLSKRGNARLRYAFWLAAVIAINKRENTFRQKFECYVRSDPKNADLKRKAYTAAAAKMARVAYGLIKTGTDYRRFHEAAVPSGRTPSPRAVEAHATS